MTDPKLTYLFLMLGTILVPFVLSFDKKVHFYKRWKYLIPAILLPAAFFIVWDILFTRNNIWSFNDEYTIGVNILNLPLEEWLFFLFVPYACVFVYDVFKYYFPGLKYFTAGIYLTLAFCLVSVIAIIAASDKTYTLVVSIVLLITLILQILIPDSRRYLFRFYVAYLVCLIPFGIVNGVLTAFPVVIYNDLENIHVRLNTIPIEDLLYFMTLFLMNVSIYELLISSSEKKLS